MEAHDGTGRGPPLKAMRSAGPKEGEPLETCAGSAEVAEAAGGSDGVEASNQEGCAALSFAVAPPAPLTGEAPAEEAPIIAGGAARTVEESPAAEPAAPEADPTAAPAVALEAAAEGELGWLTEGIDGEGAEPKFDDGEVTAVALDDADAVDAFSEVAGVLADADDAAPCSAAELEAFAEFAAP